MTFYTDKEVEGYYRSGMRVPEDVTLLWPDDKYVTVDAIRFDSISPFIRSWGNIRRFPLVSERNRTGGTGVYYHVRALPQLTVIGMQSNVNFRFDRLTTSETRGTTSGSP